MTTEEFRRRAANCLRWAQEAANERTKGLWLNMAQIWLDRAENPHWIQLSQEDEGGRHLTFRTPSMWRQDGHRRRARLRAQGLKSVSHVVLCIAVARRNEPALVLEWPAKHRVSCGGFSAGVEGGHPHSLSGLFYQ